MSELWADFTAYNSTLEIKAIRPSETTVGLWLITQSYFRAVGNLPILCGLYTTPSALRTSNHQITA